MKIPFRIFLAIEAVLGLLAVFTILHTEVLASFFVLGIGVFAISMMKKHSSKNLKILSVIFLGLMLLNNFFIWLMLGAAILYFSSTGKLFASKKWEKYDTPEFIMVETSEPTEKSGFKQRGQWFGSEKIGSEIYEWNDINFTKFAGDTIIDLGNTLLPKGESVISLRKSFGRTRILVPTGIGVSFSHNALAGNVAFEGETYSLNNETLKIFSKDYDETTRHLKIVSSVLFGEIEVIRL
ncbi:Predicted membrane protein [Pilibacter termitis]|uniref:Predicted membrane protein n=1 Tax=Pilibacter termitis TaxID=263852 RepID=A0A1T4MZ14_9ENTE|nr:cell wall-active antibiotics response protein LiaF [Pilibacter termitis]SJZ71868.1 Predicted membrane protein [Pilibacter termitis]